MVIRILWLSFAAHKVAKEYELASSVSYQIIEVDDGYQVCGTLVYQIPPSISSCTAKTQWLK